MESAFHERSPAAPKDGLIGAPLASYHSSGVLHSRIFLGAEAGDGAGPRADRWQSRAGGGLDRIEAEQRFGLKLHGYVLMPNHYHLQVETPKANLSRAIQWLNVSSYGYYSGAAKAPEWLGTDKVLDLVSGRGGAGTKIAVYRPELEQTAAVDELSSDWKNELKATLLLGPSEFVERMKKLLEGDRREQTGIRKALAGGLSWETITAAVSKVWGQKWELLRTGYGNGALAAVLYLGRNHSDQTLRELGDLAGGMQYPAVTMAIRRFATRLESDKNLAKKIKRLNRMLLVKT